MAKYQKARSRASRRRDRKHVYSLVETLAREGIQEKLEDALEAERDEIARRDPYECLPGSEGLVYRNGYHKKHCLVCGCGSVEVRVPRLVVPSESRIVPRYEGLTPEMKSLLPE